MVAPPLCHLNSIKKNTPFQWEKKLDPIKKRTTRLPVLPQIFFDDPRCAPIKSYRGREPASPTANCQTARSDSRLNEVRQRRLNRHCHFVFSYILSISSPNSAARCFVTLVRHKFTFSRRSKYVIFIIIIYCICPVYSFFYDEIIFI